MNNILYICENKQYFFSFVGIQRQDKDNHRRRGIPPCIIYLWCLQNWCTLHLKTHVLCMHHLQMTTSMYMRRNIHTKLRLRYSMKYLYLERERETKEEDKSIIYDVQQRVFYSIFISDGMQFPQELQDVSANVNLRGSLLFLFLLGIDSPLQY